MKTHFKIHRGEKSNKCNQCEYATSTMGNLRRHLKIHLGEKSHKCNQCDFASARPDALQVHLKKHSGGNHNQYTAQAGNMSKFLKTHNRKKAKQMQNM